MQQEVREGQPEWIAYYLVKDGELPVPVARPREYAGNASTQRKRRDRERTA